jgi:hypothetical protein
MYQVTLKELQDVLKEKAQAGQNGAMNKTSLESKAQDHDFQEVKRRKRRISSETSETAKKTTKSIPISTADKLSSYPNSMLHCMFWVKPSQRLHKNFTPTQTSRSLNQNSYRKQYRAC